MSIRCVASSSHVQKNSHSPTEGKPLSKTQKEIALTPFKKHYTLNGKEIDLHQLFKSFLNKVKHEIPGLMFKETGSTVVLVATTPTNLEEAWGTIPDCDIHITIPEEQRKRATTLFQDALKEVSGVDFHHLPHFKRFFEPQPGQEQYSLRTLLLHDGERAFPFDFVFEAGASIPPFSCQDLFINLIHYFNTGNKNFEINSLHFPVHEVLQAVEEGWFYARSIEDAEKMREGLFKAARLYTRGLYLKNPQERAALIRGFNTQFQGLPPYELFSRLDRFIESHVETHELRGLFLLLNLYNLLVVDPKNGALDLIAQKLGYYPGLLIAFFICNNPNKPIEIPGSSGQFGIPFPSYILKREEGCALTGMPMHLLLRWAMENWEELKDKWQELEIKWGKTPTPAKYLEKNLPPENTPEGKELALNVRLNGRTQEEAILHLFMKSDYVSVKTLKTFLPQLSDKPEFYSLVDLITVLDSKVLFDQSQDLLSRFKPGTIEEFGMTIALFQHMGSIWPGATDPAAIALTALQAAQNTSLIEAENGKFKFKYYITSCPIEILTPIKETLLAGPTNFQFPKKFKAGNLNREKLKDLAKRLIDDPEFLFHIAIREGKWHPAAAITAFFEGKENYTVVMNGLTISGSKLLDHFQAHHTDLVNFLVAILKAGEAKPFLKISSLQPSLQKARREVFPNYGSFEELAPFKDREEEATLFAIWAAHTQSLKLEAFVPYTQWLQKIPALKEEYVASIEREASTMTLPMDPIERLDRLLELHATAPSITPHVFDRLAELPISEAPAATRWLIWEKLLTFYDAHRETLTELIPFIPAIFHVGSDHPQIPPNDFGNFGAALLWFLSRVDDVYPLFKALMQHHYSRLGEKFPLAPILAEKYKTQLFEEDLQLGAHITLFSPILKASNISAEPKKLLQGLITPAIIFDPVAFDYLIVFIFECLENEKLILEDLNDLIDVLKEHSKQKITFCIKLTDRGYETKSLQTLRYAVNAYTKTASNYSQIDTLLSYTLLYKYLASTTPPLTDLIQTLQSTLPKNLCRNIPLDPQLPILFNSIGPFLSTTFQKPLAPFSVEDTISLLAIWLNYPDHEKTTFSNTLNALVKYGVQIKEDHKHPLNSFAKCTPVMTDGEILESIFPILFHPNTPKFVEIDELIAFSFYFVGGLLNSGLIQQWGKARSQRVLDLLSEGVSRFFQNQEIKRPECLSKLLLASNYLRALLLKKELETKKVGPNFIAQFKTDLLDRLPILLSADAPTSNTYATIQSIFQLRGLAQANGRGDLASEMQKLIHDKITTLTKKKEGPSPLASALALFDHIFFFLEIPSPSLEDLLSRAEAFHRNILSLSRAGSGHLTYFMGILLEKLVENPPIKDRAMKKRYLEILYSLASNWLKALGAYLSVQFEAHLADPKIPPPHVTESAQELRIFSFQTFSLKPETHTPDELNLHFLPPKTVPVRTLSSQALFDRLHGIFLQDERSCDKASRSETLQKLYNEASKHTSITPTTLLNPIKCQEFCDWQIAQIAGGKASGATAATELTNVLNEIKQPLTIPVIQILRLHLATLLEHLTNPAPIFPMIHRLFDPKQLFGQSSPDRQVIRTEFLSLCAAIFPFVNLDPAAAPLAFELLKINFANIEPICLLAPDTIVLLKDRILALPDPILVNFAISFLERESANFEGESTFIAQILTQLSPYLNLNPNIKALISTHLAAYGTSQKSYTFLKQAVELYLTDIGKYSQNPKFISYGNIFHQLKIFEYSNSTEDVQLLISNLRAIPRFNPAEIAAKTPKPELASFFDVISEVINDAFDPEEVLELLLLWGPLSQNNYPQFAGAVHILILRVFNHANLDILKKTLFLISTLKSPEKNKSLELFLELLLKVRVSPNEWPLELAELFSKVIDPTTSPAAVLAITQIHALYMKHELKESTWDHNSFIKRFNTEILDRLQSLHTDPKRMNPEALALIQTAYTLRTLAKGKPKLRIAIEKSIASTTHSLTTNPSHFRAASTLIVFEHIFSLIELENPDTTTIMAHAQTFLKHLENMPFIPFSLLSGAGEGQLAYISSLLLEKLISLPKASIKPIETSYFNHLHALTVRWLDYTTSSQNLEAISLDESPTELEKLSYAPFDLYYDPKEGKYRPSTSYTLYPESIVKRALSTRALMSAIEERFPKDHRTRVSLRELFEKITERIKTH